METFYETLKPYFEEIKEKILKNEEISFKFSNEISNSLKLFAEGKNNEKIWFLIMEGLCLIKKINENINLYTKNKEMAQEDLKIGQEIQSNIKKEIGEFVLKGRNDLAKEIQDFNYKIFEKIGALRVFEEREKIEEMEVSLGPEIQKKEIVKERKKMMEGASIVQNALTKLTIKKVEKKEKKIGKKLLFIFGILVLLAGIFTLLSIKKEKPVEYTFDISEFPELPPDSIIERGEFDLKITVPEDFWNNLNKKKKMEVVNIISGRVQEKGYLMLNFYFKDGTKIAKWVKNERTYIYR